MYTAYAERGVVSTDTDGGSYEWYMYSCTRYVLNLVSAMSCLCTLVHVLCVCTHTCTHIHLEALIFLVHVQYLHAV